jgi:hypothetical protein
MRTSVRTLFVGSAALLALLTPTPKAWAQG